MKLKNINVKLTKNEKAKLIEQYINEEFHKRSVDELINKAHNDLIDCVCCQGGAKDAFTEKKLRKMTAWHLLELIAPNGITFTF